MLCVLLIRLNILDWIVGKEHYTLEQGVFIEEKHFKGGNIAKVTLKIGIEELIEHVLKVLVLWKRKLNILLIVLMSITPCGAKRYLSSIPCFVF